MTDPELADRTYVEPLTVEAAEQVIAREKPDAILPTVGGQTALNLAIALDEAGVLKRHNVRLIGASVPAIKVAEDRLLFRDAMREIGLEVPASDIARSLDDGSQGRRHGRFPRDHSSVVHARRRRRRHRLQPRRVQGDRLARTGTEPGARNPDRAVGDRLEGIRARGDARRRRQLRRHLLDREHRSDGRAHRRQHHGGAGAHADRQGIPADARRRPPHHPPRRRRDGRIEHPVRDQPGGRPHGRHRDEPARVAIVGARVEGDRFPDRQDRREARARLSSARDSERHHPRHARLLRTDASTTSSSRFRAGTSRSSRRRIARSPRR